MSGRARPSANPEPACPASPTAFATLRPQRLGCRRMYHPAWSAPWGCTAWVPQRPSRISYDRRHAPGRQPAPQPPGGWRRFGEAANDALGKQPVSASVTANDADTARDHWFRNHSELSWRCQSVMPVVCRGGECPDEEVSELGVDRLRDLLPALTANGRSAHRARRVGGPHVLGALVVVVRQLALTT